MTQARNISLRINGQEAQVNAAMQDTVLTVLRDQLGLTAAKRGCNQGVCGACTISIDGQPMRSCLSLAQNCEGSDLRTLEGLCQQQPMRALQAAFAQMAAFQCGFCTPGMLVAAHALLLADPHPSAEAVRSALSGNLCRCTGYSRIIEAVQAAGAALAKGTPA